MQRKKPKTIPPTYFYICIIFNVAIIFLLPSLNLINSPYNLLGIFPIIFGFYLIARAYYIFKMYKTPEKFEKSTYLVTSDIYKYSRNPMYLGAIIFLIGLAVLCKNLIGFLSPIFLFLILNFVFIPYEEKKTARELGEKYLKYKNKVRRWI